MFILVTYRQTRNRIEQPLRAVPVAAASPQPRVALEEPRFFHPSDMKTVFPALTQ